MPSPHTPPASPRSCRQGRPLAAVKLPSRAQDVILILLYFLAAPLSVTRHSPGCRWGRLSQQAALGVLPPPTNPPQQRIMGRDSTTQFSVTKGGERDGQGFSNSHRFPGKEWEALRPPLCTQNRDNWRGVLHTLAHCPHTDLGNGQLTPSTPSLARQACVLQRRAQFRPSPLQPSPLQPSPLQPSPPQPTHVPHTRIDITTTTLTLSAADAPPA